MREFLEETGIFAIPAIEPTLVDVNVIDIPANPVKNEGAHKHLDFRYWLYSYDEFGKNAELPTTLLTEDEAPEEFKPYFKLMELKK